MQKEYILHKLREVKAKYAKDGFIILGLFGSVARGEEDSFSDIDIAYKIDYNKFSKKYKDGFSKILKIEDTKEELEKILQSRVDLISINSNNKLFLDRIKKDFIYV